ncbi:F0F1 ATP synthase subunit delta [Coxiella-like endosymbiont]|uniref:F0F1 ATP synthase subunit delta n=1 Tax=Coxiella-like endosymbiont TaxID=1592897 RepID=UPI00272D56A1|nr:F0F1 ATP synthase subunit delta [Coxiella-like endosymbiont]
MALHLTLARPYAKALFTEAKETDQLASWWTALNALAKIIKNKSIIPIINNPNISHEEAKDLLLEILSEIDPEITDIPKERLENFLQLMMDEKRLIALPDIALLYYKLLNDYQGVTKAEIISAFSLSNHQRKQFKKKLEKRFHAEVKLKVTIDESLIGGAIIRADNWVMDGSIRGKLIRLAENLKG